MPILRGDIYFVELNPVQGREQAGHRPVLVLSIDAINSLPLIVTVIVGTKGEISPVIIRRMSASHQQKAACQSKPSFCAFRFALWTPSDFLALPQGMLGAKP